MMTLLICCCVVIMPKLKQRNFEFISTIALVAVLTCTWEATLLYVTFEMADSLAQN